MTNAVYSLWIDWDNDGVFESGSAPGPQLLSNGTFEVDIADWTDSGSLTKVRSTEQAHGGAASMKVTVTTQGTWVRIQTAISGATVGRIYEAVFWFYGSGTVIGKTLKFLLDESGGAFGFDRESVNRVVTAGWQQVLVTHTVLKNDRTSIDIFVYDGDNVMSSGELYYIDDILLYLMVASAGDDITADLDGMSSISWETGRSTAGSPIAQASAGSLSCTLHNADGKYSSFNASSPLFGQLLPGRRVKLLSLYDAVTRVLWCGYLDSIQPSTGRSGPTVELHALGAFSRLTLEEINLITLLDVTTGDVVDSILDAIGWPAEERAIDAGITELDMVMWEEAITPLEALRSIEDQEIGFLRELTDSFGIAFESRHHRMISDHKSPVAVWADPGPMYYSELSQEDGIQFVFNRIEISVSTVVIVTETVQAWEYIPAGGFVELLPGQVVTFLATRGTQQITAWMMPALGLPDSGADIIMQRTSGSGVLADDITLTTIERGSDLEITLTGDFTFMPTKVRWFIYRVSAQAVRITSSTVELGTIFVEDAVSRAKYGRRVYPFPGGFLSSVVEAQAYAEAVLAVFKEPRPLLGWTHIANADDDHMLAALTLNVSDRVTLEATGANTMLGISGDFFIERAQHEISGLTHTVRYLASPVDVNLHHYALVGTAELDDNTTGLETARIAAW